MHTIKSTELFDMIASRTYDAESDRQMQWDYFENTGKEMERGEIINSGQLMYTGRRCTSIIVKTFPNEIKFKLVKGTYNDN